MFDVPKNKKCFVFARNPFALKNMIRDLMKGISLTSTTRSPISSLLNLDPPCVTTPKFVFPVQLLIRSDSDHGQIVAISGDGFMRFDSLFPVIMLSGA